MPVNLHIKSTEPVLVLFIHGYGVLSNDDILLFQQFFDEHLYKDIPFKVFFDLRNIENVSLRTICSLATYIEACDQGKVIASSVLVGEPSFESLLNSLLFLKPASMPIKVTTNIEAACDFLNE